MPYEVQGTTTIRWGTAPIGGVSPNVSYLIVESVTQKRLVENIKLQQGAGLTSTRVQVDDGTQWDVTVRDDSRITASTLNVGQLVYIFDYAGQFGGTPSGSASDTGSFMAKRARVIENSYSSALKTEGKRSLTLEMLNLIEGA